MEKDKPYDSRQDTVKHIADVRKLMFEAAGILIDRGMCHDQSKLESPEKEYFDRATQKLKTLTYGTPEYQDSLKELGPALDHHYKHNSHHPQYYADGIDGMSLFDVMEMLLDWAAAVKRHSDGNLYNSLDINTKRFNIEPQLVNILKNTIDRFQLAGSTN